jgi:hypothetical protein
MSTTYLVYIFCLVQNSFHDFCERYGVKFEMFFEEIFPLNVPSTVIQYGL